MPLNDEAMARNQIHRFLAALGASTLLTVILLAVGMSIFARDPDSRAMKIVQLLAEPSDTAVKWYGPTGHGFGAFLTAAAVGVVSSILFYGVVFWIILSLLSWLRGGVMPTLPRSKQGE